MIDRIVDFEQQYGLDLGVEVTEEQYDKHPEYYEEYFASRTLVIDSYDEENDKVKIILNKDTVLAKLLITVIGNENSKS